MKPPKLGGEGIGSVVDRTLARAKGTTRTAWQGESRTERIERLRNRRLAEESREGERRAVRRAFSTRWVTNQEVPPVGGPHEEEKVNAGHDQLVANALRGRSSFAYRGWTVTVHPTTVERPGGLKATAEAVPHDKSKIPAGKERLAGPVFDASRGKEGQLRTGILIVLQTIDKQEQGEAG